MAALFLAVLTRFRTVFTAVSEIYERIQTVIDFKNHVAALTAVAAVRAAVRNIKLTAEANVSVAAFS